MSSERFEQAKSNEWIQPVRNGYLMACCDCGLVHEIDFRIFKGRIQFRAKRHSRSTGAMRAAMTKRWNKEKCLKEKKA